MAETRIDIVREWIDSAERVSLLTGAGISTDSGLPDFRGPKGIWTKNPDAEKQANLQYYLADPEVRKRSWQSRISGEFDWSSVEGYSGPPLLGWLRLPHPTNRSVRLLVSRGSKFHSNAFR